MLVAPLRSAHSLISRQARYWSARDTVANAGRRRSKRTRNPAMGLTYCQIPARDPRGRASTTMATDAKLLIGKEWVGGSRGTYAVVNPATEDVVGAAPEASADDAQAAAAAARDAFESWARTAPEERAALLQATADRVRARSAELLPLIIAETGA